MSATIRVERVDITTLAVDAIVNAANEALAGGGGVDGAIHRAAGEADLQDACRAIPAVRPGVRCPTGEARITAGFRLPAKHIVHTVGPIWHGGARGEPALLAGCYRSSIALCTEHGLRTVAFPAISCGIFGYPIDQAARIAVTTLRAVLPSSGVTEVVLAAREAAVEAALRAALAR